MALGVHRATARKREGASSRGRSALPGASLIEPGESLTELGDPSNVASGRSRNPAAAAAAAVAECTHLDPSQRLWQ